MNTFQDKYITVIP